MARRTGDLLQEIVARLGHLEHEAELMRTVLIVKEPTTALAADAYDGLRKQVVAAAAERRSHLAQLTAMAVAVARATTVEDLTPQIREWMAQAGVTELKELPDGVRAEDLFEDVDGMGFKAAGIEIVEPAYLDANTGAVLRLGRARPAAEPLSAAAAEPTPVDADTARTDPPGDEHMEPVALEERA
jgi:hypothetical protein